MTSLTLLILTSRMGRGIRPRPKRWWAALFPIPYKTTKALIPDSYN